MKPLSPAERKLAAYLLDLAGDEFAHHGCNDLRLIKDVGLTEKQTKTIKSKIKKWSDDPEFENDGDYDYDWMAMRWLADRLRDKA